MQPDDLVVVSSQFDTITLCHRVANFWAMDDTRGSIWHTQEGNYILVLPTILGGFRILFITDQPTLELIQASQDVWSTSFGEPQ